MRRGWSRLVISEVAGRLAFRAARGGVAGAVVRFSFTHGTSLLPVRRRAEDDHVIVFDHPRPTYQPLHLLAVPKHPIPDVSSLVRVDASLLRSLLTAVQAAALALGRTPDDWALLVNSGSRQHVGQVHFHVVANTARAPLGLIERAMAAPGEILMSADNAGQWLVTSSSSHDDDTMSEAFRSVLVAALGRLHETPPADGGFTVVISFPRPGTVAARAG